jgi:poly(A) polymerase
LGAFLTICAKKKILSFFQSSPQKKAREMVDEDSSSQSLQMFSIKLFELEDQLKHREMVLASLDEVLQTWIKNEYLLLGYDLEADENPRVHFVTFGSYRLGINSPNADIDVLCVGPKMIKRNRFFLGLVPLLQSCSKITRLHFLEHTFVPLITMLFDGIEIDLIYAFIDIEWIPTHLNLLDDKILKNLDDVNIRCLNGSRVTDTLFDLIPNKNKFRGMVIFLKHWAKQRCIHSNTFGFLSGIGINILCAKVCQIFPEASVAYLIHKFFHLFGKLWIWPTPVFLDNAVSSDPHIKVWDPKKYKSDGNDLMPILTPAYPSANSSYAVNKTTLRIIQNEFRRGLSITSSIFPNQKTEPSIVWQDLCQPFEFFQEYKIFFAVIIESHSSHHEAWKGLVTSKMRKLILQLEYEYPQVNFHPYTIPTHEEIQELSRDTYYIGVDSKIKNQKLELADMIYRFKTDVNTAMGKEKTSDMILNFNVQFQKDLVKPKKKKQCLK